MARREMILFDSPGPHNTEQTLLAARERALELGLKTVVLATTTGETALKALEAFEDADLRIVAVTLHAGLWGVYDPPDPDKVGAARQRGVEFLTATHTLMGNVGAAVREKLGGAPESEIIGQTYYTFGQGMKVAVEVTVMAADAGLLEDDQELVAVAGTNEGADTAIVLSPAYSTNFFDLKIRELVAMPR